MEEAFLDRAGVKLHYLHANPPGAPAPAVLFLHGLSSNARFWQRVIDNLPNRRAVALDQRAHGRSSAPPHGYLPQTLAADAAALIEALGLDRVVVVGHSWGATIALELAADRPELVAGLVVIDGPIRPWSERGLSWEQASSFMQPPLPTYHNLAEAIDERRAILKQAWGEDLVEFVRAGLVEDGGQLRLPLTAPIRRQILHAMFFQPYDLQWQQVACPVLIALAEADSPFLEFKRNSAVLVSEQVAGTAVHWHQTGHDIPLEDPLGVAADIERTCLRAGMADVVASITSAVHDADDLTAAVSSPERAEERDRPPWSAKDLLAHLSSTQAALPAVARSATASVGNDHGGRAVFDPNRWNASQVERRRGRPVADLLSELKVGAAELDGILAELALAEPIGVGTYAGRPAAAAMQLMVDHQRTHAEELARALRPIPR